MEEKRNKITKKGWLLIGAGILLVVMIFRVAYLKSEIEDLKNRVNSLQNHVYNYENQINSIYQNVDEKLKAEASLLAGSEYSFGKLTDGGKVPFTIRITPKEVTQQTAMTLTMDGETIPMKREGSDFTVTKEIGMFIDYDQVGRPKVTITEGEIQKSEFLEKLDVAYLFHRYLPSVEAHGSGHSVHSNGELKISLDFSVHNQPADENSQVTFTKLLRVEEINGEEVGREDITEEVLQQDGSFSTTYSKTYQVEKEDELRVYVVATDSLGYVHKTLAHQWFNVDGDATETIFGGEEIYAPDGTLLYGMEK
ncbi:MAG: hypothetical protein IJF34_04260 [Clostridia bacterium]|nr:hypothetical protein [Clostridia bacterium]